MEKYNLDKRLGCKTCDDEEEDQEHFKKVGKFKSVSNKRFDYFKLCQNLYEAILFPEKAKGFKFPAQFQIPTYTFQTKTSFYLQTNNSGVL
jgi:hypothetical protein